MGYHEQSGTDGDQVMVLNLQTEKYEPLDRALPAGVGVQMAREWVEAHTGLRTCRIIDLPEDHPDRVLFGERSDEAHGVGVYNAVGLGFDVFETQEEADDWIAEQQRECQLRYGVGLA